MDRTPATRSRPHDLRRQHPPGPVTAVRPDPEAWRIALELGDGDAYRLEVLDDGLTVIVHNR